MRIARSHPPRSGRCVGHRARVRPAPRDARQERWAAPERDSARRSSAARPPAHARAGRRAARRLPRRRPPPPRSCAARGPARARPLPSATGAAWCDAAERRQGALQVPTPAWTPSPSRRQAPAQRRKSPATRRLWQRRQTDRARGTAWIELSSETIRLARADFRANGIAPHLPHHRRAALALRGTRP